MKSKEKLIKQYLEDCYGDFVDDYDTSDVAEHFTYGLEIAEKQMKQQILDLKNKYKSHLQEETNCKIGKNINFVRETELKAKISLLIELEKKLKL